MKFLTQIIKGIAIGAGAILPGISSGVLCVIFNIYEKLINSILGFFKDIKGNIKFLFPIVLGISLGILIFSKILIFLFDAFPNQTKSIFIGLILGCLPSLFKKANEPKGFRLQYIFYLIFTLIIGTLSIFAKNILSSTISNNTSILYLILSGFLMSAGVVIPGVSSSVILMELGIYDIYLEAISNINMLILIQMGIGILLGGFIFLKLIQYCIKKYYSETYYSIIGFVIGSVFILLPNLSFSLEEFISIGMFVSGLIIGALFEKFES